MTKLSVKDHTGYWRQFDQPVSIRLGKGGVLFVYNGEVAHPKENFVEPVAAFHGDWCFEWHVRPDLDKIGEGHD